MSTLKLKGSTSGYVEITAPATAGDNQITLPTTAGTITVKDASGNTEVGTGVTIGSPSANVFTLSTNGSERLRVDSSGNINVDSGGVYYDATNNRLAIGTTSPSTQLSVVASSANGIELGQDSDLSTDSSRLFFSTSAGSNALQSSSGSLRFFTGSTAGSSTGTERVRIDSSGRLLVGTSSTSAAARVVVQGSSGSPSGVGILYISAGTVAPGNGDAIGAVLFSDSSHTESAFLSAQRDGGTWSASSKPTRLVFFTTADGASSPTERMRINNQGGISGYAAGGWDNYVASNSSAAGTSVPFYNGRHSASGTFTGTNSYYVWTNGNVQNTNGSYTAISDAKLKENIVDAGSQWSDLKTIRIRNWNFKAETGHETHRQIGPIAQELETVCPGLVFATPDRDEDGNDLGTVTKGVNYSVLYMKAVKALQEAQERIETLESENVTLKSDFTALATRVTALESA